MKKAVYIIRGLRHEKLLDMSLEHPFNLSHELSLTLNLQNIHSTN